MNDNDLEYQKEVEYIRSQQDKGVAIFIYAFAILILVVAVLAVLPTGM